jgi:hypothetical protein
VPHSQEGPARDLPVGKHQSHSLENFPGGSKPSLSWTGEKKKMDKGHLKGWRRRMKTRVRSALRIQCKQTLNEHRATKNYIETSCSVVYVSYQWMVQRVFCSLSGNGVYLHTSPDVAGGLEISVYQARWRFWDYALNC